MAKIRRPATPFNCLPLGAWAALQALKVNNRAARKLAHRTGMPLTVASVLAELNRLGPPEYR